ncbi:MAG: PSD1 and planctomycete cytochrome C domain-containing protein [Chloroherpetonaceae bacterium]|nr:PSD1 and planctomycete cytochrome C domain-containing protein [Chthonomonadaceae bacterium]MDW8206205.1 PSD1 and planctomycete cytochrome C domain-containing protein [Chloroherpetonaceae bacterium]
MKQTGTGIGLLAGTLAMLGAALVAAEEKKTAPVAAPTPAQIEFFETRVRPVLFQNCFSCHGAKQQMGSLRLDTMAHILKGNSAGPAVVPGDPDRSPLIQVIRYDGKVKMPPAGKLKAEEIEALTEWVRMGAPWPGVRPGDLIKPTSNPDGVPTEMRRFWSFQPVRKPPVPRVKNATWVRNPIDAFILAKLEAKGLSPAPPADRRTLIRRAYYGLIGLPPTAEEIEAFVQDRSPGAWEKVIDRLLASPHYGERWGRYWLDVARYADTKGYVFTEDINLYNAYTYRDWVIRAFNEDLPYDRFILQQLAADLLPQGEDRRPLAALGFLTIGRRFLNDRHLIIDDQMDVTVRGIMGLSIGCARCHDHKYDPIPAKDYYALYGVFASTVEQNPPPGISPKHITEPYERHNQRVLELEQQRDNILRGQMNYLRGVAAMTPDALPKHIRDVLQTIRVEVLPNEGQQNTLAPYFQPEARNNLVEVKKQLAELQKSVPPRPEFAMAVRDGDIVEPRVFIRGNPGNPGERVPRRFLAILTRGERKPFTQGSGRLELAQAIASKDNPLTARVFVNRVWMYHFDRPIVRTPGDFGTRGEKPTHPELLDWLAATFMENGWSIKKLHRIIMLSNAYQMRSTVENPLAMKRDPENFLLWRQNRQRLDLEALRDSLLAASGQLDRTLYGRSVELTRAPYPKRRSVYGFIDRNNLQGFYRTFDFASPDMCMMQRPRTTVPQQALFMMNNPFVVEQARALAAAALNVATAPTKAERTAAGQTSVRKGATTRHAGQQSAKAPQNNPDLSSVDAQRIRFLYRRIFGRYPSTEELQLGLQFVRKAGPPAPASVWQYGYGRYDENTQRVVGFTPLPHFTGQAYQGSAQFPDSKLHYLMLNAEGGHVGVDRDHAAIRRWTAPFDATVTIRGTLAHEADQGDGVQAYLVSSRAGTLGYWSAFKSRIDTVVARVTVKRGETLDFVVDCRSGHAFDSFRWAPVIQLIASGTRLTAETEKTIWSAQADFSGPPSPAASHPAWEQYAHALLMTNEFCFVD